MNFPGWGGRVEPSCERAWRAVVQSGVMRREGGFQLGLGTQLRMEWPVRFGGGMKAVRFWGRRRAVIVVVVPRRSVRVGGRW